MKVKIKRFDKSLPLPEYKTTGSACFDLYAREEAIIGAGEIDYIPLNLAIQIPIGCWAMLVARSSTHKLGIMLVNGIGIGDQDFSGDDDEYKLAAYNFTKNTVTIEKGTRIAQMMIVRYEKVEFEEMEKLSKKNRGGFGSTGSK